ncbi:alpha/beta fold hydrolase [Geodermatophilus marinus]|uniref:alpha/beta fold hydrolase n=1 Tax=Geodermatophilus sp. LHW52908 TaxID=2303986 RepID=UPI000E3C96B0|nr:alpha/beta fold hydrolase [Geodermatophilus sp. LHW52908]RFU19318.1 alpha/beta fold hydrolase [Geodermatophilus sp. LHW52908]
MTAVVLVHGAWGGAHGFRSVRRLLAAAGQEVTAPALTGIGERVHLTGPQVGLDTHVTDVVNHVRYEDLTDVVLVGFSYGGMVVTGALDEIGDRVRALVYLDAFVPDDGDSVYGLLGVPPPPAGLGAPWLVDGPRRVYEDPAEEAFSVPRRTPQPVRCFTEPVRLSRPVEEWPLSRTYVRATEAEPGVPPSPAFAAAAERARTSAAWTYRELAATHMLPQNRPREVADLLLELTG